MPRSRVTKGKLSAEVMSNGLIASAVNLQVKGNSQPKKVKRQEWQEQGWYWYDTIEVFHYACQWVGNTLSKGKLVVLENGKPTTNQVALDALESFYGGSENHGEFLRQAGIHMTVAGECFVVGQDDGGGDIWMVAAATEVKNIPDGYKIDGEEVDPNNSLIFRLWRPHPRKPSMSDSPTRPLLPVLGQLDELTKYVSAQLDSRLSGAGILFLPLEISFPTQTNADGDTAQQAGLSQFMLDLAKSMEAAKQDRSSSSARVPLMAQAPAEYLDKINHVTFWSELDEHATELRNETIRRIALGMDMPPEALMGTADVNHWGAWQIEDSLIKSHAEPLLALITEAITYGYLRVVLESEGMSAEDAEAFSVMADTAEMRLRPNRSKEAIELGDRLLLSDEAVRRENGFNEDDAPDEKEINRNLLLKIAQGSPGPDMVAAAAEALGLELNISPEAEPSEERPLRRSLEEHPTRDIPDTQDAEAAALLASAEAAVFRALERCGNKLKSTLSKIEGVPKTLRAVDAYMFVTLSKSDLDHVLEDAWGTLDLLTLPASVDRSKLEAHLDNYARMLISSRQPYNRDVLSTYLGLVKRVSE